MSRSRHRPRLSAVHGPLHHQSPAVGRDRLAHQRGPGLEARGGAWQGRTAPIGGGVVREARAARRGGGWKGLNSPTALSADEVRQRDPEFCSQYKNLPVVPLDVPGGHAKGRPDAPVTIVEFSDFECGHCKLAYEGLKQALPISLTRCRCASTTSPRRRVQSGDEAGGATSTRASRRWRPSAPTRRASSGSITTRYSSISRRSCARISCLCRRRRPRPRRVRRVSRQRRAARAIRQDVASGTKLGIDSTPTLYINGRTVRGALRGDTFGYAIVLERAAGPKHEG